MKVKIKLTHEQFCELVKVIGALPFQKIEINNIEFLNLKQFYLDGIRKIHSFSYNHAPTNKLKTYSIDLNQYQAIKIALDQVAHLVTEYVKAIFLTIKQAAELQILRGAMVQNLLST